MIKILPADIAYLYRLFTFKIITGIVLACSSILYVYQAQAAVVQCGSDVCSSQFSISFNGNTAGGGELLYDAATGTISLNTDQNSISGNGTVQNDGSVLFWRSECFLFCATSYK